MSLIRWNPVRDMSLLQQQMNRLFDDTLHGWPTETNGTNTWFPATDVYETENDVVLRSDLPGIDPKQIDIRVENNVLTIRGERSVDSEVQQENYHRVERLYGTFSRSFTLTSTVDADKIKANYKDGVLTITLPKAEAAKPKRIQIAAAA